MGDKVVVRVAGIIRKSPTNKGVEESIDIQKDAIVRWCASRFGVGFYSIDFFVDRLVSGDDPNRPELLRLFSRIDDYDFAVAHVVDRYVRSHIGLNWFFEYFAPADGLSVHSGCRLCFVEGCPDLYDSDGYLLGTNIAVFGMFCLMGYSELLNNRRRTNRGRDRLRGTPEWSKKFPGGKPGRKWKSSSKVRSQKHWSKEEFSKAVRLREEGKSAKDIGLVLGRSAQSVINKFNR